MPRGLRPVFFALFLAAAVTASAGPDDLFDARAPGALQPGQREFLLALENGRYTLKEGRLLDSRPADPARPQLSNARVAELLAGTHGGAGGGSGASAAGDAAIARSLARVPKGGPAQANFDGDIARGGGIRGPPSADGAASSTGRAVDPAVLQAQFLQRLVFKGTKPEREALGEAIATILKTRTGRELATQFVAEKAVAEVKMSAIANSTTIVNEGKKTLSGTSGMTDTEKDPPLVEINRAFLETDPEYRRLAVAGTLAHELFGHAFEQQRAKKAGLSHAAHYFYRGDEAGSRLIDWMIQTELSGKTVDGDPETYLADVEGYHRDLITTDPYYTTTMSRAEMKNPATTLKGRRQRLADAAAAHEAGLKDMNEWRPIIEHFVKAHKVTRARLKPAETELSNFFAEAAVRQAKLAAMREQLEGRIAYWATPEGMKEKQSLIQASDSPYMIKMEATLAARARALRRLQAAGRDPASGAVIRFEEGLVITASPGDAPIDLDELGIMYREDKKKNPGHWK